MDDLKNETKEMKETGLGGKSQVAIRGELKSTSAIESHATISDDSDSVARSALATTCLSEKKWNIDSGTMDYLVPESFHLKTLHSGTLLIRTANNRVMNSSTRGTVSSPVPGIDDQMVHKVPELVELLWNS